MSCLGGSHAYASRFASLGKKNKSHRLLTNRLIDETFKFNAIHHRDLWWSLIECYTGGKLTYIADRWVAFSGLANRVVRRSQHRLIAGLWLEDIVEGLLWAVKVPGVRIANDAPTWSWISVDGRVSSKPSYNRFRTRKLVEVIDTPSNCGEELQWRSISKQAGTPKYPIKIRGSLRPLQMTVDLKRCDPEVRSRVMWVDSSNYLALDTCMPLPKEVWGMVFKVIGNYYLAEGLLLTPVDVELNEWKRLGHFTWSDDPQMFDATRAIMSTINLI